jgi:hypothetical protein
MRRTALSILLFPGSLHFLCAKPAFPQGETTSAIVGQVTDATNAAIPARWSLSQIAKAECSTPPGLPNDRVSIAEF